jgi:chitinase
MAIRSILTWFCVAGSVALASACNKDPGAAASGTGGVGGLAGTSSESSSNAGGAATSGPTSSAGGGSSGTAASSTGAGGGTGSNFAKHALVGYWHNFNNPSGCAIPLSQVSDDWDVIVVAFAQNDPISSGGILFSPYPGETMPTAGCAVLEASQLKADIAAKRAAGKIVALSLGGAEGNITLENDSDEANFVESLTGILMDWGFDGIDVDLESGSGLVHGSQIQTRLVSAIKKINQNMGGNMYLSMAPEHPYVQGGVVAFSSVWGAYLPIIDGLRDELDLLHVQLYNNSSVPTPNTPAYANGKLYPEATVDSLVVSVTMLVEGFTTAGGWQFKGLPASKIAFGLPSGPSSSNSPVTSNATIESAFHCLTEGTSCGEHVPSAKYPDFRGVMTWSINWDKHDGYPLSKEIAGFLHGS